jgi:hypothetical protein
MGIIPNGSRETARPNPLDRLAAIGWSTNRGLLIGLFSVLGVILLAPVWTVRYPPLIDYPNHLASAFVLAHLKSPTSHFSEFYASNWSPTPYLAMDLIIVGLERFLPVMLAGRIFLSFCLLAVPAAVWFFIRQANPGQESLAFWSLLLSSNMYFFLYGFLNLQLAFALCFVVLGLWLRYLENPRPGLWWLLLVAVTALYFTHLVGYGVAGIVVTSYLLVKRRSAGEMLRSWLLFVPGAVFYQLWVTHERGNWSMEFQGLGWKAKGLLAMMLGYSPALDFLTLLVIAACILWAGTDNREFRWNYRWLGIAGCLFAVYLALPSNYGSATVVDRRLMPFLFVIALAGAKVGKRGKLMVPIALLLFVLRAGNVEINFRSTQSRLENLALSFSFIPTNSRVLPFIVHQTENPLPEDHFWAYGVIERGWFSPYLFHDRGVQPFQVRLETYTPGQGPEHLVASEESIKWDQIQADYDYVWAYASGEYSSRLEKMGKLVFDSGNLQVFRLDRPKSLKSNH